MYPEVPADNVAPMWEGFFAKTKSMLEAEVTDDLYKNLISKLSRDDITQGNYK